LNFPGIPIPALDFAKHQGPAVAQLRHILPKLVPGINHRNRIAAIGQLVAAKGTGKFRTSDVLWINIEQLGHLVD